MIVRISGKLIEKKEYRLIVNVNGLGYEVYVPGSVSQRLDETIDSNGNINLIVYHYFQMSPTGGVPMMVGFINEVERDFFLQFITVSGIGPRAAIKALTKPISEITRAIDVGDISYLKTLPGIGMQRAKEIVAKLQGKVGRFGLIQDKGPVAPVQRVSADWQDEALEVLIQLQYKKQEALDMIKKALERAPQAQTAEELLNEIYKQKVKK